MTIPRHSSQIRLQPADNQRLANLCGQCNEHLQQLEKHLNVDIHNRGHLFHITGSEKAINITSDLLKKLYKETETNTDLTPTTIHLYLQESAVELQSEKAVNGERNPKTDSNINKDVKHSFEKNKPEVMQIRTKLLTISPRTPNQTKYIKNIYDHDINFVIGPAGTGKTYLAVACAVEALEQEKTHRILLVRPAIEAGERLGFLPGDLAEKVNPYLRPLYDALYDMLGFERVEKLIEHDIIEIAPLAYMRGRTLNDAFIILDEGQNTTRKQMKMFLTRIGFNSKTVITGDITQTDLPLGTDSGLKDALRVLKEVEGIGVSALEKVDVVRHKLVQSIIQAYEQSENQE